MEALSKESASAFLANRGSVRMGTTDDVNHGWHGWGKKLDGVLE
jgi:hypothetical protein